ncbi:MAG: bifunctional nuclease family protein [Candidatus Aenigmarchaeota archaeon]|nr:bifunctional nuclease family protein [Candidatus Aenigmarchaeota archaeon]
MNRFAVLGIVLACMIAAGLSVGMNFSGMVAWSTTTVQDMSEIYSLPQLSTDGYVKPNIEVGVFVVQLSHGCRGLILLMDGAQTDSIARGISKARDFRPNTHDVFGDLLDTFGMELLMVKIDRFENGAYYADMMIRQGNKLLQLDSRPSDAIAVAVRTGSSLYVKEGLFEEYGMDVC